MNIDCIQNQLDRVVYIESVADYINKRFYYTKGRHFVHQLYIKLSKKYSKIDGFVLFDTNGIMNRNHYVKLLYAKKIECFGTQAQQKILSGMYSNI
jgi:hypothetical protein